MWIGARPHGVMTDADWSRLQEYVSLEEEVTHDRRARLKTFALALVLVVVLLAGSYLAAALFPDTQAPRLVLIYLAHVVIIVALLLTHRRTHHMEFTAGYLRTIVEPGVKASWRERHPELFQSPHRRFESLESARALGGCYALLVSAIVVAGITNGLYRSLWAAGLPLLALTGVMSANLLFMSEGGGLAALPTGLRSERRRG